MALSTLQWYIIFSLTIAAHNITSILRGDIEKSKINMNTQYGLSSYLQWLDIYTPL